ncbi:unnamed protein product, partial [Polarella glacialis]
SLDWTRDAHGGRALGVSIFFDGIGTLPFDHLQQLLKSAMRLGMLGEVKQLRLSLSMSICQKEAATIWEHVKLQLEAVAKLKPAFRKSKYGDVLAILGLDNSAAIEEQVQEGQVPMVVLAYYFICKSLVGSQRKLLFMIFSCSPLLGFLHPLVLYISGRAAFGTSPVANAIYGLRVAAVSTSIIQVVLFASFPLVDGFRRVVLSDCILASFGRGELLATELFRGRELLQLGLKSESNLRSFWVLTRLTGPNFELGIRLRYSSAYVAASVLFLCAFTAGVAGSSQEELAEGVLAEVALLFALGSVGVVSAALLCMRLNAHVPLF